MLKDMNLTFSVFAFVLYIVGGLSIFSGLFMLLVLKGRDLFGWGTADTIGYLFLCVGACLSVAGVLTLRVVRNRTDNLIRKASCY